MTTNKFSSASGSTLPGPLPNAQSRAEAAELARAFTPEADYQRATAGASEFTKRELPDVEKFKRDTARCSPDEREHITAHLCALLECVKPDRNRRRKRGAEGIAVHYFALKRLVGNHEAERFRKRYGLTERQLRRVLLRQN